MPLGPWAIAKRSLRIQIVFLNQPYHHLLDGVMDMAATFSIEGKCLIHYSIEELMKVGVLKDNQYTQRSPKGPRAYFK